MEAMPVGADLPTCRLADWMAEPLRFSHLQWWIAAVSQKTLTQIPRALERDGPVSRTVTPIVPVTVHQQPTSMGFTLLADIGPLQERGALTTRWRKHCAATTPPCSRAMAEDHFRTR
jgi:DNA-binding HxlR family transcriptional regulator